jgi:hypothetical protein
MSELIERAKNYATNAHRRIDQRRKYSGQPYDVHLDAVACMVASVTDDEEMIAAAWLHDVVEDTPATVEEVERQFGKPVAMLVEELTDVSRPSDGNRTARKEMDRLHTSLASSRAKTIKLADLIDNCEDISRHDPRFARTFLQEMDALLAVLGDGDQRLFQTARTVHAACLGKLPAALETVTPSVPEGLAELASPQIIHTFQKTFTAGDIADPLLSFDTDRPARLVLPTMKAKGLDMAGIRVEGVVQGFVRLTDIEAGGEMHIGQHMQHISTKQTVDRNASLIDVIGILTRHDLCFVSMFDSIVGVIDKDAVNKPVARMWLFGAITVYEMWLVKIIEELFPNDSWESALAPARLEMARELQQERERRKKRSDLIDCLQFSDKAHIVLEHPAAMAAFGLKSKRVAKQLIKELESLRNHLAHSQDIVAHDWVQIIRITQRMAELNSR